MIFTGTLIVIPDIAQEPQPRLLPLPGGKPERVDPITRGLNLRDSVPAAARLQMSYLNRGTRIAHVEDAKSAVQGTQKREAVRDEHTLRPFRRWPVRVVEDPVSARFHP